ncbi:MAG: hypothetical protein IPG69_06390 [Flavobacteriales bacterium]|nr:hypothetical protein [Flavobacteriales bacterium]
MRPLPLLSSCFVLSLHAQDAPIDTSAVIARIEARMAEVNQAPIIAEYIKVPGMEEALLLEVGSQVPKHAEVRYELYGNDDRSLAGLTEYLKSPAKGVELSSSYYFDTDGNTVAVWWKMTWTFSGCADSLAVETSVSYLHPATHVFYEYANLTDGHGTDIDPEPCKFPDIEREYATFYHRDMLLLMRHIPFE